MGFKLELGGMMEWFSRCFGVCGLLRPRDCAVRCEKIGF